MPENIYSVLLSRWIPCLIDRIFRKCNLTLRRLFFNPRKGSLNFLPFFFKTISTQCAGGGKINPQTKTRTTRMLMKKFSSCAQYRKIDPLPRQNLETASCLVTDEKRPKVSRLW